MIKINIYNYKLLSNGFNNIKMLMTMNERIKNNKIASKFLFFFKKIK